MNNKLNKSILMGYGVGDFSLSLIIACTGFYLLYFYTDVYLINPAIAGVIIMSARIFQGIMNPFVGLLSDRLKFKWGNKRSLILFGSIPLGILFFFIFAPAGMVTESKILYAFISSILFFVAYSVTAISYSALAAVITQDSHERSRLSAWRMIFALSGNLLAAGATIPLVRLFENEGKGFRNVSIFFGLLAIIFLIITFLSTYENKAKNEIPQNSKIWNDLKLIFHNKPFIIICSVAFISYIGSNIIAAVINYYFKYILNAEKFIPLAFSTIFGSAALAIPFFLFLAKKIGKKNSFITGLFFLSIILSVTFFIKEINLFTIELILVLAGICISTLFLFPYSLMPDTVEYLEWKTGRRLEGMLYGVFILFMNLASATSSFIVGLGLKISGYVPNVDQLGSAQLGIKLLMTLVPAFFIAISIVLLLFYPIDEAMHNRIVNEIKNREK